jgi:hypothetical protein
MNDAFLKMLWNLIIKPDDLWCKVLYSKYGRNNDLRVTISSQPYGSPLCKVFGKTSSRILYGSWMMETRLIYGWKVGIFFLSITNRNSIDTTLSVRDVLTRLRKVGF